MSVWLIVIGLVILGFLLILAEIFLIPGFNIFGVLGLVAVVAGVVTAYSSLSIYYAHLVLLLSIITSLILVRLILHSRALSRMVLNTAQSREAGISVQPSDFQQLVGKIGITYTNLRPAGHAIIDDQKYDVVSEGGFVEKNLRIEVVEVNGNRIVVREVIQ
jgi:membrane-bound serine protease (ClpP class)